jgi:hypothetical protein
MKPSISQILGIIRHLLTFVGGILVAKGTLSDATATQIIGGVVSLIGLIWSIVTKQPLPPDVASVKQKKS